MGGDHGHHDTMKIPDYKIYKVEDVPRLMKLKATLEREGLKDPWMRNEVYKYQIDTKMSKSYRVWHTVAGKPFIRGGIIGVVGAIATYWYQSGDADHGHGDGHH